MTINDAMTIRGLMGETSPGTTSHRLYLASGSGFGKQIMVDIDNDSEFLEKFGDNLVSGVNVNVLLDEHGVPDSYIVHIIVDELML